LKNSSDSLVVLLVATMGLPAEFTSGGLKFGIADMNFLGGRYIFIWHTEAFSVPKTPPNTSATPHRSCIGVCGSESL
jgi:hypothetical protein